MKIRLRILRWLRVDLEARAFQSVEKAVLEAYLIALVEVSSSISWYGTPGCLSTSWAAIRMLLADSHCSFLPATAEDGEPVELARLIGFAVAGRVGGFGEDASRPAVSLGPR